MSEPIPGLAWGAFRPGTQDSTLFIVSGNMLMTWHADQWHWNLYGNEVETDSEAVQFTSDAEDDGLRVIGPVELEVKGVASTEEFAKDAIRNGVLALWTAARTDGDPWAMAGVIMARNAMEEKMEGSVHVW